MMKREKNKVLVLEACAKASVPVIESCKQMGLSVIAGAAKKYGCGLSSRAVDQKICYPPPDRMPQECIVSLLDFLKANTVDVLIPVGDVMTDLIAKHQNEIRRYTRLVLPPYDTFVRGRNKILTLKAAVAADCPIPLTWYPADEGLEQAIKRIERFPVLIKPAVSAGARGIVVCRSGQEILANFSKIQDQFGECFLQDYVSQAGMQFKVDAVIDADQVLLAGVVYEKLRYYPPGGGSSVLNRTVYRPDILAAAERVMRQLGWVGLCDFDFITDPQDGIVKLMEINPRFPESYRATVAAGVDMTKIICQMATGQQPEKQIEYKDNQYNRFLFGDMMWFLKTKGGRFKAKPSFFRFWGKDMYYQLLRKNDCGPIWGYCLENMAMLWNKKLRRERLR